ncbi:MAG: DUF11 domain-containing protein [Anaerolineae bacterium]|nr:DUF11 domain-containing protein [Anaerolineae bacterium]
MKLSKKHQRRPAQALVEFSLVALVFLFLLVMIIEVARILQAYVTIQHAARQAARVAVTGEFDPKYGVDPLAGWDEANPTTADPLQRISPCWPLFWDDPYDPTTVYGVDDPKLYQPYRGPRTCTIEEAAIRSMAGLIMDPNALPGNPNYYEVLVSGSAVDKEPETGTFERGTGTPPNMATLDYASYYHDLSDPVGGPYTPGPYAGENGGASRGYGGDPGKKVQVQIEYRVRMITPLLSNIMPSVRLTAIATMTNETFGSLSLQREAALPPASIIPEPFTSEVDLPDLYISELTCTPTSLAPTEALTCTVKVKNQGFLNASSADDELRIYIKPDPQLTPLVAPLDTTGMTLIGTEAIGAIGGQDATTFEVLVPYSIPTGFSGDYYVYAWADADVGAAACAVTSAVHDGCIQESDDDPPEAERIDNNLKEFGPIEVMGYADLAVTKTVDNATPAPGDTIIYTITVINNGGSDTSGVVILDSLPSGVTYAGHSGDGSYNHTTGEWDVGDLANGQTKTLEITATVDAGTGGTTINNTAYVFATDITDPVPGNDQADIDIQPGSISMTLTKSVDVTEVNYGTSPTVTYTIVATNTSTTDATNVQVTDGFDTNLQSLAIVSGAGCSIGSNTLTCSGALGAGASETITVTAEVIPTAAPGTEIDNVASAIAVGQMSSAITSNEVTVTVLGADIEVVKEANISSVSPGQQFTYTVEAINRGPSDAQNVSVSDVLPADVTYVSHAATAGTGYNQSTGLWTIGDLADGDTAVLTINVTASAAAADGTVITNTATLQAGSTPPQGGSYPDSDSVSVTVVAGDADLALTKTVNPTGSVYPGTTLTYTLTLTNNGPLDVTNRAVEDTVLANAILNGLLTPVNASVTHGTYAAGQWTGIDLLNGEVATATIEVVAVGTQGVDEVITNTASIVPGTVPDNDLTNNADTATIQINWPDPVFINAGDPSQCNNVTWGSVDSTLGGNFDWTNSSANWSLSGGDERRPVDSLNYIESLAYPTVVDLSAPGQNLFGCHTRTSRDFTYSFTNLHPGTWRLYLAFADYQWWEGYPMRVETSNGGAFQTLPGMANYDIVAAINAVLPPNMFWAGGEWNVHYIIEDFDGMTVNASGQLDVKFTKVGSWNYRIHVNGLGVEYVGP